FELVVDGDAERLEHARGRIHAARTLLLDARDEAAEVGGGLDRPRRAATRDRRGDTSWLWLLAILGQDPRQNALVRAVHQVGRRDIEFGIGSHVQRSLRAEAEPARIVGQLERREAEIEQDAVAIEKAMLACNVVANREVGPHQDGTIAERREPLASDSERGRIDRHADEPAVRRRALEDARRVTAATERAIDEATCASRLKGRD